MTVEEIKEKIRELETETAIITKKTDDLYLELKKTENAEEGKALENYPEYFRAEDSKSTSYVHKKQDCTAT